MTFEIAATRSEPPRSLPMFDDSPKVAYEDAPACELGGDAIVRPSTDGSSAVLFVDLDGTLIKTDMLHEAGLTLLKKSPRRLLGVLPSLARGRAAFKRAVSDVVTPDICYLPFREEVLQFIAEQRILGRKIILATAADAAWAQLVANELGLFDGILASDGKHNLSGEAKLAAIQEYCREHGYAEFDYLGDGVVDLPIWRASRGVCMASPSGRLLRQVRTFADSVEILGSSRGTAKALFAALRPQHWVKNILVFVPLIASHQVFRLELIFSASLAFVCFSLCASAVYVLNDLADISADRRHPVKRGRPFASGDLALSWGLPLVVGLLTPAVLLCVYALSVGFAAALVVYFIVTCVYSFAAKRIVMLDVLLLAGLYTIRVLAGGAATGIVVSDWLMAFSMFLFVSLAFAKRYAELERLSRANEGMTNGRGYRVSDIGLIESMGPASGYISVLVLALYMNGEHMKTHYRHSWPLWLICPLLMYWISRVWIKAKRAELTEDPIVFALTDRVSVCLGVIGAGLFVADAIW